MDILTRKNQTTIEGLTKENIYKIVAELLKDENMKSAIIMEIAYRIMNTEPVTCYDMYLIDGVGNPECSTLGEIAGTSYGKLKPQDILYENGSILFVLKNISTQGVHKYHLHEKVLIDIVNILKYGKEKALILNIPTTPKIEEFLKKYKTELLKYVDG